MRSEGIHQDQETFLVDDDTDVPDEVAVRTYLAHYLPSGHFPADSGQVRQLARDNYAPDHVLATLARLPNGVYADLIDVWESQHS